MKWALAAAVAAAALIAYLPFLGLPFISDDYTQIRLARIYGPPSGWAELAADPLYRSRATSLIITWLVDSAWGLNPVAHNAAGLLLHCLNSLLVLLFGLWRRIGFAVSVPAALFFAVYEGHQEAVVWNAALPELLVFLFGAGCALGWALWLQDPGRRLWMGALAAALFLLALYSKESAVAILPVLAVIWRIEAPSRRAPLILLGLLALIAALYAALIFLAAPAHLHLNDGTFHLRAPFWRTLPYSLARMLWIWGFVALAVLAVRRDIHLWRTAALAAFWSVCTLAPYSFLTYMDRVPSRHTYLAALGISLLAGLAWRALPRRAWPAAALAATLLLHNTGYLWMRKLPQFERRAEATNRFIQFASQTDGPIVIECAPYGPAALADTAHVALGLPLENVLAAPVAEAARYCDPQHP